MMFSEIPPDVISTFAEVLEQIAAEVNLNRPNEILSIAGLKQKAGPVLDDIFTKRADIRRDDGQPEREGQKQHAALEDLRIRKNQHIGRFEIQLHLLVGNELIIEEYPFPAGSRRDQPLNVFRVLLRPFFQLARNDQTVLHIAGVEPVKCVEQVLEAFVRRDPAEEEQCLFVSRDAQPPFRFGGSEVSIRERIVDRMTEDRNRPLSNTKVLNEFILHLLRMDEDMVN